MSECEHVWTTGVLPEDYVVKCVVCLAELSSKQAETILNEHAALKREMRSARCPFCATCLDVVRARDKEAKTEGLTAEAAKDIVAWEGGASGHIANMKNWRALQAYAQLEAEIALKADYIKRLEAENAVLIKRLWDYEHQASDERIRDEK